MKKTTYLPTRKSFIFSPPPKEYSNQSLIFKIGILLIFLLPITGINAEHIYDFESLGCQFKLSCHRSLSIDGECDGIPVYGTPGVVTPIAQLPSPLPSSFKIDGILRVTGNHTWSNLSVKMGDAAQIIIDQTASFSLTNGTVIEGCETMWKGVTLLLDATLVVGGGAEINDAVSAIFVTQRCTVQLNTSQFKRNFRTLLAVSPTLQNISFNLYTAGSVVDGAGPLKPPHTGQSFFEYGPKGESGFRFVRCSNVGGNLKVGDNSSLQCLFRNCEYGVSSASSFLTVENSRFEEFAGATIFGGYGIYGEYGYYKVQQCEFYHCNTGVSLYKMNFLVDDNSFSALNQCLFARQSVYYVSPAVALPTVTNNTVENVVYGFIFFQNDNSNPQINNNTFPRVAKDAVSILDIPGLPNASFAHTNTIQLGSGGWPNTAVGGLGVGIHLTNTRNAAVCNNTVSMSWHNLEDVGIVADGSSIATITNNTLIQEVAGHGLNTGIQYTMTDNSTIDCNKFTNLAHGMILSGVSTLTKVSKNTFIEGIQIGMLYVSATTQVQPHTGNRWTYPTDADRPGAQNIGSDPAANKFVVDAAESANLLPFVVSAPGWFENESTPENTPLCNPGANIICTVPIPFAPGGGDEEMISKIINDELTFSDYSDASAWLAARQALSWIAVNGLTTTAPYATYWAQNANASQGKLAQLEANAILWKASHTTQEQQMGTLWGEMLALMEGTDQSQAAQDSFEYKRQQLETLRNAWDSDFEQLLSNWATVNATLPDYPVHVFNVKRLNALMLDIRTRNPMAFTAAEMAMLEEVAEQCLFSGGTAVLQARTLLSMLGSENTWDDAMLCSERGQDAVAKVYAPGDMQVMPNPNDGSFQILLPAGIPAEGAQAFLYDMAGRLLRHQHLRSINDQFDTAGKTPPGLYLLEVRDAASGRVGLVKINIQ